MAVGIDIVVLWTYQIDATNGLPIFLEYYTFFYGVLYTIIIFRQLCANLLKV